MADDEQALIAAARLGDGRALESLLVRHERQVYRFGLRMCGSEDVAKDVLQQTLMTAFKDIAAFRGEATLSTWLFQIARSFCIKARRPRKDEPAQLLQLGGSEASAVPSPEASPEDAAHARQIGEALHAAILALPLAQREVLVLRDVEGLTAEEAAEVIGVEVGAVKSRLHRARMEVRKHLSALLEPSGVPHECPELRAELSRWVGAEIDQATCTRIEDHMSGCARCAQACEALKNTVSLCRNIPGGEVPAPVRAAVRQALRALVFGPGADR